MSRKKRGQSVLELAVLIMVVALALVAMQVYLKRGIQGRLRSDTDRIGEQYDYALSQREINTTSSSLVLTDIVSAPRTVTEDGVTRLIYDTNTTSTTVRDDTRMTSRESIPAW